MSMNVLETLFLIRVRKLTNILTKKRKLEFGIWHYVRGLWMDSWSTVWECGLKNGTLEKFL
jgi:hypothetical protein